MFPSIHDESQYRISTIRYIPTVTHLFTQIPEIHLCCTSPISHTSSLIYDLPFIHPLIPLRPRRHHTYTAMQQYDRPILPISYPPPVILPISYLSSSVYDLSFIHISPRHIPIYPSYHIPLCDTYHHPPSLLHHTLSDIRLCGMTGDTRIPLNISPHISFRRILYVLFIHSLRSRGYSMLHPPYPPTLSPHTSSPD